MTGIPSQFHLLGNALRYTEQGHRVLSQNIANVNTPGYQAKQLTFDQLLEQAESGVDCTKQGSFQIEQTPGLTARSNGNNVDLDGEVSLIKKNAMLFQTYSQLLASQMNVMRKAISG